MNAKYYRISHSPDTTETGMPQRRTYVQAQWNGHVAQAGMELVLETWCEERFGSRVAYVQGVAPCRSWSIQEIDEKAWREAQPIRWGGMPTKTIRLALSLGAKIGNETPYKVLWEQEAKDKPIGEGEVICPSCGHRIGIEAHV